MLEQRRPTPQVLALRHRLSEVVLQVIDRNLLVEEKQIVCEQAQVDRPHEHAYEAQDGELGHGPLRSACVKSLDEPLDGRDEVSRAHNVVLDLDIVAGNVRRIHEHQCEVNDL